MVGMGQYITAAKVSGSNILPAYKPTAVLITQVMNATLRFGGQLEINVRGVAIMYSLQQVEVPLSDDD